MFDCLSQSMEVVGENVQSEQCRICLEPSEAMINLFEDSKTPYKLALCCGVEIPNIPSLPSKMCKKCSDILNVAYGFRVLCQRSQEYLTDQQILPEDDTNKPHTPQTSDIPLPKSEDESEYLEDEEQKYNEQDEDHHGNYESAPEEQTVEQEQEGEDDDDVKSDVQPLVKSFPTRPPRKAKSPITYMCNICANLFRNKATFNYHMKLHRNEKRYECEICSKRFMQTCELRAHIRVHTGEKPYSCKYCDRKFRDRSGVTRHERTHTNERPYGCTICGAHFSYSATLKKHERVHTGEKPFKCKICDKGFSEAHQIKAHLATIRHAEMAKEKSKMNLLL